MLSRSRSFKLFLWLVPTSTPLSRPAGHLSSGIKDDWASELFPSWQGNNLVVPEIVWLENSILLLQEKEKMPKFIHWATVCLSYAHSAFKVQMGFSVPSMLAHLPSLLPFPTSWPGIQGFPGNLVGFPEAGQGLHRAPGELNLYRLWKKIICSKT